MNKLQMQELEELQLMSAEELEGFNIDSIEKLNWAFRKMSAINVKVKDIENLANAERERITHWENKELKPLKDDLEFFKNKIEYYHFNVLSKDPKSKTIKTPYGTVKSTTRKASPIKSDEEVLLNYLFKNKPEYVEQVVEEKIKWAELKKELHVVHGLEGLMVIDSNGNIVEGVDIEHEKVTFKVEVE